MNEQIIPSQELVNKVLNYQKPKRFPIKRLILITAIIVLSFTMVVSAFTVAYNIYEAYKIYNETYMLPGLGLFDGFNETVRAMPKVLQFGETTIELAMTYEQDGIRKFNMVIYAEGNRNTEIRPDINDYTNLELIFPDGMAIPLTHEPQLYSDSSNGNYSFKYRFEYDNFPEEYNFILTNNINASTEIELFPLEAHNITISDNGIKRIKMIPAAIGSRIYSYNIEVIAPSLAEKQAKYMFYSFPWDWLNPSDDGIYLINGLKFDIWKGEFTGYGAPIFATDEDADYKYYTFGERFYHESFIEGEVDKIIVKKLQAALSFGHPIDLDENYIRVDLPVPQQGERIDYDTPLQVAEVGEFTISINGIERLGEDLCIYVSEDCYEYSGYETVSDIHVSFISNTGSGITYNTTQSINIPLDYSEDTIDAYIVHLDYTIHGYWEIDFE